MENQHKIKILFRLRSLEMGGVPRVVLDLLRNLPKDKFDLTLMLNLYQGELRTEIPKDIRLITLAKGKEDFSQNPFIQKVQLVIRRLKLALYEKFPSVLYKLKVKDEFDIEVAPGYAEFEWILNSPNKKSRKVGWFHTDIRFVEKKLALKFIDYMKKFDVMIFGSKQTKNVIKESYGIDFSHGRVIYNVIDCESIQAKSEAFSVERNNVLPQFISVARLQKRKGFDMLAKVHKRIVEEGWAHEILIIGDGNFRAEIQNLIDELKIENTFKLLGTKTNPYPYIKAADYFILPSKTESYPLIIGEVLCLAKPIISTDVGGINEMIDHDIDGMLVQPLEDEIYLGMKKFLTEKQYVKKLQSEVRNSYLKFDKHHIYKQVEEVFTLKDL